MITIIDCNLGNTGSVANMIKKIGSEVQVSSDPAIIEKAEKLILPGVGKFDYGMNQLAKLGLIEPLNHAVLVNKKPILGICLGAQLLTEKSEEGTLPGLAWIKGRTVRFNFAGLDNPLKIPHMGWNSIIPKQNNALFSEIHDEIRYYFVHSYHIVCDDPGDILATTIYGYEFISAVNRDNIFGVQFHPEKSHKFGMALLNNFVNL